MKVGVVGASGYVGGETLRLLVNHPNVEITMVTSRQHVGEYLHRVQPSLKGFTDLTFSELDYDKLTDRCDLVFTAVPHGTATEIVKAFVVLTPDRQPDEDLAAEIKDFVKVRLAAHEYPREVEFVKELPMTATGKIMRRELKKLEVERKGK